VRARGAAQRNSLRQRAEKIQRLRTAESGRTSRAEPRRAVQQAGIHRTERELQNDELRRLQLELEVSRNRYLELFDFAPVGYFTLDNDGVIDQANLAGGRLLGVARRDLVRQPFSRFLSRDCVEDFHQALGHVLNTLEGQVHQATLTRAGGAPVQVLLEMSAESSVENRVRQCFLAVVEITALELEKETLRIRQDRLGLLTSALLLAQEAGRRRIARELHDGVNQRLAVATIDLERLATMLPDSHLDVGQKLRSISAGLAELSDYIRDMAHQLKPAALEYLGLRPALESECAAFSRRIGIPVRYACRGRFAAALPPEVSVVLFRIAQECLQNTGRHARARRASVTLLAVPGRVRLSIRDDGIGFDADAAKLGGIGIMNMEESLRLVGGSLTVQSRPGCGTRVRAEVPLARNG
jgi:PAS domain S-box-containing protein